MNYELSSVEKRALNTRTHIGRDCQPNPQMYTHSHTPTMVLGGGGVGVDRTLLSYFETILTSAESL